MRDPIQRTAKAIQLISKGPVTIKKLKEHLGVSKVAAKTYIDTLSLTLPIYESGLDRSGLGRPATVYEFLKEKK